MKTQQLHQVLNAVWAVVADANRYFAGEAPWALARPIRRAGHGALCHRRGDPPGRDPGAAVHAGVGRQAARPARRFRRTSAISRALGGAARLAAGQQRCRRRRRCSRAMSKPDAQRRRPGHARRQPLPSRLPGLRRRARRAWSRAPRRPASAAWSRSRRGCGSTTQLLAIAERFPDVFCSVGTHPHNAHEELDVTADELVALRAASQGRGDRRGRARLSLRQQPARGAGAGFPHPYRGGARDRPAAGDPLPRGRRRHGARSWRRKRGRAPSRPSCIASPAGRELAERGDRARRSTSRSPAS